MRIAILADPVDKQQAGIHTFTVMAIRAMIRNRGDHEIILIRQEDKTEFKDCTQYVIADDSLLPGYSAIRVFFLIPRLIRKLNVDAVIHPAHFGPFNLPDKIKRITIIHDLSFLIMPRYHRWHSQFLQRLFLPRIFRHADLIVTNSEYTTSTIEARFPLYAGKIETILLGKNPSYYPDHSTTALDTAGIDRPFFHYLGTIEPRKDLGTLLEAFHLVRDRLPEKKVHLVVAGAKGWKSRTFNQAYRSHPYREDIHLIGRVPIETARQLHTHSLSLVYPSVFEGFGLPILEAMSCGGKVIAADNTSLPEVGGDVARYFKTGDARDLADRMLNVLNEPRSGAYKHKALEWSAKFSWDEYARSLIEKIKELDNLR